MNFDSPLGSQPMLGGSTLKPAPSGPTRPTAPVDQPAVSQSGEPKPTDLTTQNLGQRSANAMRNSTAKVAPSPFALFKSMMKGPASFAQDLQAVKQASAAKTETPAPKTEAPPSGFAIKATRFVSQLSVTRFAVNELIRDLGRMQEGDTANLDGETSLGAQMGVDVKVASGSVSGELKAATSVKIDCHGGPFMVTIQTHGSSKLGVAKNVGLDATGCAKGRSACMETRVFACDSAKAAAELVHAFHNKGSLDIQGVTTMHDDRNATKETTNTTRTVLVKGHEKATAAVGLLGSLRQRFDSRSTQQLEVSETTSRHDGNTMVTRTYSMASEKSLSALSGLKKALTLGGLNETKVATRIELETTQVSDFEGETVMKGDLSLQMDSEKIEAMATSFKGFGAVVEKETNRLVAVMESANEQEPGTFDVSPSGRDAIRSAVHNACAAIVEDGKKMQGRDAGTQEAKLGGDVGLGKVEVGFAHRFGGIVTIKLPFSQPETPTPGGPKLQLDTDQVEYGVTHVDAFKVSASVGAEAKVVSASFSASTGKEASNYIRFRQGVAADIEIHSLSLDALGISLATVATGDVEPHAASDKVPDPFADLDDDFADLGPSVTSNPQPIQVASNPFTDDDL